MSQASPRPKSMDSSWIRVAYVLDSSNTSLHTGAYNLLKENAPR